MGNYQEVRGKWMLIHCEIAGFERQTGARDKKQTPPGEPVCQRGEGEGSGA